MLPASKGLNYLPRMPFSSTGFSLWILVHAITSILAERVVSQSRVESVQRSPSGEHVRGPKCPPEGGRDKSERPFIIAREPYSFRN